MSLEKTVSEHCSGLYSNRASERKKSAESLKQFLTRNAVPSLLSENTNKKQGYTWSNVFNDISEYILKETEKYETTKNFETVTLPLCSSLLHLCVSEANKGRAYIKCDNIIYASLYVLKDARLTKAVGDVYLSLLYKHVLTQEYYLSYITPNSWEELLNVCLSMCVSKHSTIDSFTRMKLLLLVVKNGTNYCQFIIPLRDSLPQLKKCFHTYLEDKKVQDIVIEIMIILMQSLAGECRLTICEMTESLFLSFLKCYDQNSDYKKKNMLFKLLDNIISVHHPKGALRDNSGSLANDWTVWTKQLHHALEVVYLESIALQKPHKQCDKTSKSNTEYSHLAAMVYYQVINTSSDADAEECGSSSKRQRVSFNKNKTFSDLLEEMKENHVPWLEVIHMYMTLYGDSISTSDYLTAIVALEALITKNNVIFNWKSLQEICCMCIKKIVADDCLRNEYENILISFWNSCVRMSAIVNSAHEALHTIVQLLLKIELIKYNDAFPLIKLYFEKGMPVTNESVQTLTQIFHKFFSKCSKTEDRIKCFSWLVNSHITSISFEYIQDLMIRLLSCENVDICRPVAITSEYEFLHNVLFETVDEYIVFSEFDLDIPKPFLQEKENTQEMRSEFNAELQREIKEYLQMKLSEYIDTQMSQEQLLEFIKIVGFTLCYIDITIKRDVVSYDVKQDRLYNCLENALKLMYENLSHKLKNNSVAEHLVRLIKSTQNILMADYAPVLKSTVRSAINDEFFHCINTLMCKEDSGDDDEESNLKSSCLYLLAAYCIKQEAYTEEILKLILDASIYDFTDPRDANNAFECIRILHKSEDENPPIEAIFTLMQHMCKHLFRNPKASYMILKYLSKMLSSLWFHDENMKQNCFIMIKSYLQRCEKMYYPPYMAALVYECAAKMTSLNLQHSREIENDFIEVIMGKIKGDVHSLRLYCCYLLKIVMEHQPNVDVESYSASVVDIFVIKVSEKIETVLKDESANRTLTVLHSFQAINQTKSLFVHFILTEIIQIQHDKSLDQRLVKKVLDKITNVVTRQNIQEYVDKNILSILNYWFLKNKGTEQLPLTVFGFRDMSEFVEKYVKWLVAADILWRKGGVIKDSDVLKYLISKKGQSAENVIEMSISNILVLCLPYIVVTKYRLSTTLSGKLEWNKNAHLMFESSRQLLGAEKWSALFAENMSELFLLVATHLCDNVAANQMFSVQVPSQDKSFNYTTEVFLAILRYFGELIDGNIMQNLCESLPLVIFKTLFQLWRNVLQENIFEFRVLALHTFIIFLENVPLGYQSDAFVCNFACYSMAHAIKDSRNKAELTVFVKALRNILERFLAEKVDSMRNSIFRLLSILMIKKEEGYSQECSLLLEYIAVDMKHCLKETEDVVDFFSSLSQGVNVTAYCSSKLEFLEKLKTYTKSLLCPSLESLKNLRDFLIINKTHVMLLGEELNRTGFSDDCGTSVLHQTIHALCCIMKSTTDDKTIIEASNCIVEIGNFDLKTLGTVPPDNARDILATEPRRSVAVFAIKTLSENLFDENPEVTRLAAKSLKRILKYTDGHEVLSLDGIDTNMLKSFESSENQTYAEFGMNSVKWNSMCSSNFWIPQENENYSSWVVRVTVALLDVFSSSNNYLVVLRAICTEKSDICHKILPPLLGLLLECSSENQRKKIAHQVNNFFKHVWDKSFEETISSTYDSFVNTRLTCALDQSYKIIIRLMLDVVNFVRLQKGTDVRPSRNTDILNYLNLDYDKVAWAATVADQNVVAIYYGELWATANNDGVPPASPEATSKLLGGENVQRILRKCLLSIGEMDALDGCGTAHLTDENERRKHLISTGQYSEALLMHDIALSCLGQVDQDLQYGAVKSLHKSGMHHLAVQYIKSLPESEELNDIKYECLSFLGDWSDFVDTRDLNERSIQPNCNIHSIIKAYRYSCLKDCLNVQTNSNFENKLERPINHAKLAIARLCQRLNMENCQSVYRVLSNLHLINDIEDYHAVRCNKLPIRNLLNKWQLDKLPAYNEFKHLEAIISQRSLILEQAAKTHNELLENIVSLQLQYAELSLSNDRVQIAQRLLAVVKKLQTSHEVTLVDSQISWAKGHKDIALSLIRNIIENPSPDVKLTAISLRQYGLWMAESKCDNARDIIHKYLKKSLDVLASEDHEETRLKVYYDIAKFADSEYKQIVEYMNSSIFEKKVKCLETMKDTVSSLRATQQLNPDDKRVMNTSVRFGEIDQAEINNTKAEKESFLQLAMKYYLLTLKQSEANDLSIFRVISLWLDNQNLELTDCEHGTFEDLLHSIPSWKYITVLPQLGPRLTNDNTAFVQNLKKILKRCAKEHPHHTLPILLSLQNSDKDDMILNASGSGGTQRTKKSEPRVEAATNLVQELESEGSRLAVIIKQMKKMCDATISFANYVPKEKRQKQDIPAAEMIHRLGHLDAIPVPTESIPVRQDSAYSYLPSLYSFEKYFELVGGINCPKKIKCRSSDGSTRILLIKGKDDLRQDAMMQQVFKIVNTLLEKNPVTSRNKLSIRTYKVVPMSRRSGVLEWCEGTIPIGHYLIGNNGGAHARYRPQDITANAARDKLTSMYVNRKSNQEKLVVFLRLLRNFRPVFHYFFTENYLDPVTWYERRLAYTKSVAASSMVGYIMGLGDRHLQNILIDKRTAEVIHIDFGIAFDQGKTLPTPETIPFRLTQDIIAGFGSSGVEGTFRRCCEKTMQLLRDNHEMLLTILEVLICDPLYSWTVTSKQQNVIPATRDTTIVQSSSDGSLAKRALLTVSSKLTGTAGGVAVPGLVARLVHAATDDANLARLYPGWQPYL